MALDIALTIVLASWILIDIFKGISEYVKEHRNKDYNRYFVIFFEGITEEGKRLVGTHEYIMTSDQMINRKQAKEVISSARGLKSVIINNFYEFKNSREYVEFIWDNDKHGKSEDPEPQEESIKEEA